LPIILDWELNIELDHILSAQGSDPKIIRERRPGVIDIARWALDEGNPLFEPAVLYNTYDVDYLRHERLQLKNSHNDRSPIYLSGSLITQHMGPAKQVILMICTIGNKLEKAASNLMQSDPLHGWALDSLGSAGVETLATDACNLIEFQFKDEGMQTTIPLSPGMVGWPVEEGQNQLFSILDSSQIGVSLTENYLMIPKKSVSLVLGVGDEIPNSGQACDYCNMKETCKYQYHYTE
jgi:hypothetical protein